MVLLRDNNEVGEIRRMSGKPAGKPGSVRALRLRQPFL